MLKVLQTVALLMVFLALFIVTAFASDTVITLESATLNGETVTIKGSLTDPVDNQQITFIATDLLGDSYNPEGIFYIDQQEAQLQADNSFTLSFNINVLLSEDTVYIVRVGGTNIPNPAQMIITTSGGEGEVLLGDVNLDGIITAEDASITLQEVLFHIETLTDRQIAAMKVTKSDVITSSNASEILYKSLDSMYEFSIFR